MGLFYAYAHYCPFNYPYRVVYVRFIGTAPMIGRLNRVYEILNHKRPLTLKMIWKLHRGLDIPAESLIRQPDERRAA